MRLSSIFNFESLRTVRVRPSWTLPLTLLVVLAIERGVLALPEMSRADPVGSAVRLQAVENMILPRHPRPRVAVLGSSRACFGVCPVRSIGNSACRKILA
ncbi:MAG: hypothetical protein QM775_05685 [Pirellulales bacterium]